jgi:6-pyruvoyltetrahydropterin/6-carboxytetrahydropterin synthase
MSDNSAQGLYQISVKTHFDAAHLIRGHRGKCRELHGHRWDVEVIISTREVDELGMAVDFALVKDLIRELVERYDHCLLNDLEAYATLNPTAENIAKELYEKIRAGLPGHGQVALVRVWESPECWASYSVCK